LVVVAAVLVSGLELLGTWRQRNMPGAVAVLSVGEALLTEGWGTEVQRLVVAVVPGIVAVAEVVVDASTVVAAVAVDVAAVAFADVFEVIVHVGIEVGLVVSVVSVDGVEVAGVACYGLEQEQDCNS
jgi:hypothetical protein